MNDIKTAWKNYWGCRREETLWPQIKIVNGGFFMKGGTRYDPNTGEALGWASAEHLTRLGILEGGEPIQERFDAAVNAMDVLVPHLIRHNEAADLWHESAVCTRLRAEARGRRSKAQIKKEEPRGGRHSTGDWFGVFWKAKDGHRPLRHLAEAEDMVGRQTTLWTWREVR